MMDHVHSEVPVFEYNLIVDGIYIGTNQCCVTHFDDMLQKEGIRADISLEEDHVDMPFGVDFYTWIPIANHTAPTQEQLDFGVTVLAKMVALGKKVYVHCKNGHGRAPSLVAAYLVREHSKTVDEALEIIKAKRRTIHVEDVQREALQAFATA